MDEIQKNYTVFGSESDFDGRLEFTDNLKIVGHFNGTIVSTGNLIIDKVAVCNVDKMEAQSIIINGTVTGNIEALEHVEMCSGSKVKGDVVTSRIRIADNVDFEGQITMLDKEPEIDLFSAASDEYKQSLVLKSDTTSDKEFGSDK